MSAEQNVETVRRLWDAFGVDGLEATLAFVAPDVRTYPTPEFVEERVYEGHDGVRRLIGTFLENFDNWEAEVREIREAGSRVLALLEMSGQIKGSGVPVHELWGAVYSDFRDGMIGEVRFFTSPQEALEAVGLEE